jgi:hypothetical protein
MRQALLISIALAALSHCVPTPGAGIGGSEVLDQARTLLANREPRKAAALLEDALPSSAPSDRVPILDLLRQSYRNLISQAEAEGKTREVAEYQDNLAILDQAVDQPRPEAQRPPQASPAAALSGPSAPAPMDHAVTKSGLSPLPRADSIAEATLLGEPSPDAEPLPLLEAPGQAKSMPAPAQAKPEADPPAPATDPAPPPTRPRDQTDPDHPLGKKAASPRPAQGAELSQADQMFTDKKYEEAGRIYARLAALNQLPAQRKQIWAYCRWVAVVGRINSHPGSDRQWDEIEGEIRSIQRLVPGNWYGEYLLNRVAEARRGGRPASRPGRLVIRGSAPEESPTAKLPRMRGQSSPSPASPAPDAPSEGDLPLGLPASPGSQDTPAKPPAENREAASQAEPGSPLSWHVHETANFRVYHTDPAVAAQAARVAEVVRSQQAKRWGSTATRSSWSPRCEIYLYPTPRDFAQMTGQPETSPGFSTMGINGNRIIARRVNLRADHPQLLTAILPHEVTHVVLADLFTMQQIPRWADEGMAVLAEPIAEQKSRAGDLTVPLKEGRVFKLSELMAIDYPNAEAWSLYYAQSVSVTRFLVEQGTPEQFIAFVRGAQRQGIEQSLREVYRMEGFPELENRWRDYAHRQIETMTASSRDAASEPDPTRRQ